jgi:succinyl-CoA synthetase beta subunit
MDRAFGGPVIVASPKGGMDIEAVAAETPDLIYNVVSSDISSRFQEPIDIEKGIQPHNTRKIAEKLGFKDIPQAQEQMKRLYDLFIKCDATQVEINPFVETVEGKGFSFIYDFLKR